MAILSALLMIQICVGLSILWHDGFGVNGAVYPYKEGQEVCSLDWLPVCGNNYVTYGNICMMRAK